MGEVGSHAGAVARGDAAHGEQRALVALAEGLEALEGVDRLDGELGEGDHRRDLADVLELLVGELGENRGEACPELVQARGLAGHAHRPRMPPKRTSMSEHCSTAWKRSTVPTERPDPRATPSCTENTIEGT